MPPSPAYSTRHPHLQVPANLLPVIIDLFSISYNFMKIEPHSTFFLAFVQHSWGFIMHLYVSYFLPFHCRALSHCTDVPHFLFIPLIDGHLYCFPFLTLNRYCPENSCIDRCMHTCFYFFVAENLGVERLAHIVCIYFNF